MGLPLVAPVIQRETMAEIVRLLELLLPAVVAAAVLTLLLKVKMVGLEAAAPMTRLLPVLESPDKEMTVALTLLRLAETAAVVAALVRSVKLACREVAPTTGLEMVATAFHLQLEQIQALLTLAVVAVACAAVVVALTQLAAPAAPEAEEEAKALTQIVLQEPQTLVAVAAVVVAADAPRAMVVVEREA